MKVCGHCNKRIHAGTQHINLARMICFVGFADADTDYIRPCAFGCGKPATVYTSADDFTCEKCKNIFEDALELEEINAIIQGVEDGTIETYPIETLWDALEEDSDGK